MALVGLRSKPKGLGLALKAVGTCFESSVRELSTCRSFIVYTKCQWGGEQEPVNICTVIFLNWEIFWGPYMYGHIYIYIYICVDRNNQKWKLLLKIYVGLWKRMLFIFFLKQDLSFCKGTRASVLVLISLKCLKKFHYIWSISITWSTLKHSSMFKVVVRRQCSRNLQYKLQNWKDQIEYNCGKVCRD